MAKTDITALRLRELLHYNPETGGFTWRQNAGRWGRIPAGSVIDPTPDSGGYLAVRLDGALFRLHRLAWLYVHGVWPSKFIDHRDGNPTNNRIENLRDVDQSTNMQNLHGPMKHGSSGFLGVHFHKAADKFEAFIHVNGRKIYLGLFDSPEEAHTAHLVAKRNYHGGCTI